MARLGMLSPVDAVPLSELAYGEIRSGIVNGSLPMGEQLIEAALVEQLGVSRAPIREALRRLAEEGLVIDVPRRGTYVRTIDVGDLIDVCNTRLAVESVAARLIVRNRLPLEPLEKALDKLREVSRQKSRAAFIAADLDFHTALCSTSGNAQLARVFRGLAGPIQMAIGIDEEPRANLRTVADAHAPLINALARGTEPQASHAIQEHVLSSVRGSVIRLGGDPCDLLSPLVPQA